MPAREPAWQAGGLLHGWYQRAKRELPWRATKDPYRIWLSEIMLQQTRVAAVIPYYEKFLARFPTVRDLAEAPEQDVLTAWAGLGYYSRARNLQKAAQQIVAAGEFPNRYDAIRVLPGVGDYTAAAIASIAFGLPHVVVDGNVLRVMSRLVAEPGDIQSKPVRDRLRDAAQEMLDRGDPGEFNQALMELGATVCLPRDPQCLICPLSEHCEARRQNRQAEFPVKLRRQETVAVEKTVLVVRRRGRLLLWRRPADSAQLAGFWELPDEEHLPGARQVRELGEIRHGITNHSYSIRVVESAITKVPESFRWVMMRELASIPLSTVARKAIQLL